MQGLEEPRDRVAADWHERRDELEHGQVFRDLWGQTVMLLHRVPGDATSWRVLEWHNGWVNYERRVEPGDLAERLPREPEATTSGPDAPRQPGAAR